jgi:phosphoribosylamine--glycine ligase
MGAYSPVPAAGADTVDLVLTKAVEPTLAALRAEGIDYRGVLYAGLMLTAEGPKMLEYNVRFADPETQVVLQRLAANSDLAELLAGAASGRMSGEPAFVDAAAVNVVLATEGYPASPRTGDVIDGLADVGASDDVTVFCAGVAADESGRLVTAGGRVLNVTATGPTIADARRRAYAAVSRISWPGMQHRHDIAEEASRA